MQKFKRLVIFKLKNQKKFLAIGIKCYGDEVKDFYDKEIPKVGSNHTCLPVTTIDSALKGDGNYYPQVFLKYYKYIEKEKNSD